MRRPIALAAFALAAPSTLAAEPPPTPSLNEARRLSPRDLAARLLGPVGGLYREARIYDGGAFGPRALSFSLATAPRPTGFPGLCEASVMVIWFALVTDSAAAEADMATRAVGVSTSTVFGIVGDTGRSERGGAYEEQSRRLCAEAGPVLPAAEGQAGQPGFFQMPVPDAANAYLAARALQQALADARAGSLRDLACTEDSAEPGGNACADPRALLIALSPGQVTYAYPRQCAVEPADYCVGMIFARSDGRADPARIRHVEIVVDSINPDPQQPAVRVARVAISHATVPDPLAP